MDRTSLLERSPVAIPARTLELTEEVIQQIIDRQLAPLRARIEQLEVERRQWLIPAQGPAERPRHQALSQPLQAGLGEAPTRHRERAFNPYHAQAGPELDALIHRVILKRGIAQGDCPAYSTDVHQAKKVLAALKSNFRISVLSGRTSVPGRPWFVRVDSVGDHPTEVLAETWSLAVCRLALIQASRKGAGKGSASLFCSLSPGR